MANNRIAGRPPPAAPGTPNHWRDREAVERVAHELRDRGLKLDPLGWQEEQPPVRKLNQLCPRWLVLLEIKGEIGERRDRQVSRRDSLLDGTLPKSRRADRRPCAMRMIVGSDQWPRVFLRPPIFSMAAEAPIRRLG
jgi:hypothetical protein